MLMDNTIVDDSPSWFKERVVNKLKHRFVDFGGSASMYSYAKSQNCLDEDGFHPNQQGQKLIASKVNKHLKDHAIISTKGEL
jgi:lysophospholipase L1-like esterase